MLWSEIVSLKNFLSDNPVLRSILGYKSVVDYYYRVLRYFFTGPGDIAVGRGLKFV